MAYDHQEIDAYLQRGAGALMQALPGTEQPLVASPLERATRAKQMLKGMVDTARPKLSDQAFIAAYKGVVTVTAVIAVAQAIGGRNAATVMAAAIIVLIGIERALADDWESHLPS